ncbi:MAG: hypothetical protein HY428_02380 [Candidatus Levybacteria bacterium]|nr:hypothetical protein [Candidatus Levybacteria bacterium]
MNKPIFIGIVITILLVAGFFIFPNSKKNTDSTADETSLKQSNKFSSVPQTVNKQASFAIFTNGIFRIFTASMYHNLSDDVYIEASNSNIVKVKKAKITWDDFFKTLPFTLAKDCLTTGTRETFCTGSKGALKFYLNGEKNENALNQEIKDGDKLLVTFGNESEIVIKEQLDQIPNP